MSLTAAAALLSGRGEGKEESFNSTEEDRFDRTAESNIALKGDDYVVLTLHGVRYDMSSWARAHPGGAAVLKKYHQKDATKAFERVGHSDTAHAMLRDFVVVEEKTPPAVRNNNATTRVGASNNWTSVSSTLIGRWKRKLFTNEDPYGLHKSLGIYCLLHYAYRYGLMLFGDPSAGLGTNTGRGASVTAMLCVVPHAILSLSSLLFHTVPRERVVGKPMIWQEFRLHNIIFGARSVLATAFAWIPFYFGSQYRPFCVLMSCLTLLAAIYGADWATRTLCPSHIESTTATMPYWEGCSLQTQRRFKSFYAWCQFLATLACVTVANPAWPLAALLPIQLASLLMTLVRKGLISTRAYHLAYTWSLCMPFCVGFRQLFFVMQTADFFVMLALGTVLYQSRRRGYSKYALWASVVVARLAIGDTYINYHVW